MGNYNIDQLRESMVKILQPDGKTVEGSGFIIRSDGYLVTCHHVIFNLEALNVEYDGQVYEAEWCEDLSNPEVDIAILKIEFGNAKSVPIINPADLSTSVIIYGFPASQKQNFPQGFDVTAEHIRHSAPINTCSTYYASDVPQYTNPWNTLPNPGSTFLSHRIDINVDPGTSGGAVYAEDLGGVVGVIQCNYPDRNESYAIRWDNITEVLDKLGLEPQKNAVCRFLKEVENNFKYIRLFHTPQKIALKDQYIPIEVTLERRYRHEVETTWGYVEGEAELTRAYAMKGFDEGKEEMRRIQVPWKEMKQQHKRIIVLADPGMGKTALLKMETVTIAQEERQKLDVLQTSSFAIDDVIFPLFLRLSELVEKDEEIIDVIPNLIQHNYPKTAQAILPLLQKKLENGKCLLLLDALDEVPKEQRNSLSKKLNCFARNYPCPIICTSRIVGYGGGFLDGAKEMEIVPFSRKQTEQYIETWFKNAEDYLSAPHPSEKKFGEEGELPTAKGLIRELRQKPQIRGLTQNPLLLSFLCSLYQEGKLTLPTRRVQIYKQAVEYMLSIWSRNRKPQSEGRIRAKLRLLEELAYSFSCEGKGKFTPDELYDRLEAYLIGNTVSTVFKSTDSATLMEELTEDDGIIQTLGNQYIFLHRTFQEYLTASYLNRQKNGTELAKEHFWDYDWYEIITLFAGLLNDPIPLLKAITSEKDDIFSTRLLLAGRCIAECEQSSHPLITAIIDEIYLLWHSYPLLGFIRSVIASLAQLNTQVFEKLQEALKDKNKHVRHGVVLTLEFINTSQERNSCMGFRKDRNSGNSEETH